MFKTIYLNEWTRFILATPKINMIFRRQELSHSKAIYKFLRNVSTSSSEA